MTIAQQGRGVFDCTTGQRCDRDDKDADEHFDPIKLTAPGFGLLAGKMIRMAGLFGGGLPLSTRDDWFLEARSLVYPTQTVFLTPPSTVGEVNQGAIAVGDDEICKLRAYGFSETGQSFVIATSCNLTIFAR